MSDLTRRQFLQSIAAATATVAMPAVALSAVDRYEKYRAKVDETRIFGVSSCWLGVGRTRVFTIENNQPRILSEWFWQKGVMQAIDTGQFRVQQQGFSVLVTVLGKNYSLSALHKPAQGAEMFFALRGGELTHIKAPSPKGDI